MLRQIHGFLCSEYIIFLGRRQCFQWRIVAVMCLTLYMIKFHNI
ncbi:hypothetical protein NEISICOT_02257 [Neisseria sicca ATCC 29256]|uniref:Uncharacterized protein n=1 Tax=Neisseria sicca ATCC 29256 TaxID=547045 RepID=C6M6V3_NEISI|nr:hypothetical protein NEISICOT_02257 [Neisseria sicca ATCC 29256]